MNRKQLKTRVGVVIYPNENNEIDATKHQELENQILEDVFVKEDDSVKSGDTTTPSDENYFTSIRALNEIEAGKRSIFNSLSILNTKGIGASRVSSCADMKCIRVEEFETYYRCFFDNDNGNILNLFETPDQAICQIFNGAGLKYYWRLVTGVGADYIDLSKTDYDGTGIPGTNDSIVQLGNRTNPNRQNALILSSVGKPSIKEYVGINSYTLEGCEENVIEPGNNKLIGELHVSSSTGTSRVPRDRGAWTLGMECTYYDRVSNGGALWLCKAEGITTEEPTIESLVWERQVEKGETGEDSYTVNILSSNGNIFTNGLISTTLTAKVFKGGVDITDTLNLSCFKWVRSSSNPEADATWNQIHEAFYSNILNITQDDVYARATFDCKVTINN